jgi:hypothetical protein
MTKQRFLQIASESGLFGVDDLLSEMWDKRPESIKHEIFDELTEQALKDYFKGIVEEVMGKGH